MTRKKKTMDGGFFGISSKITNAKARNTSDADFNQLYQQLTRVDKGFLSRMGNEVKVGDRILDFLKIFNYRLSRIKGLSNQSNLDEFYNNSWKSELKFYKKQMRNQLRYIQHPLHNNYNKIMKKLNIELVEICEVDNIMYCILHTYKINILKRKWKKYLRHREVQHI